MTTQVPPTPIRGSGIDVLPEQPTQAIELADGEEILDALPLLDHRTLKRTIEPGRAPRGHYLAMAEGEQLRLLPLEGTIIHIGRGTTSELRLEERRVSRSHAILVRHGRHVRVLDNRSSHGTFVNGRRIIATNLADGDVVRIGPVAMQYLIVD